MYDSSLTTALALEQLECSQDQCVVVDQSLTEADIEITRNEHRIRELVFASESSFAEHSRKLIKTERQPRYTEINAATLDPIQNGVAQLSAHLLLSMDYPSRVTQELFNLLQEALDNAATASKHVRVVIHSNFATGMLIRVIDQGGGPLPEKTSEWDAIATQLQTDIGTVGMEHALESVIQKCRRQIGYVPPDSAMTGELAAIRGKPFRGNGTTNNIRTWNMRVGYDVESPTCEMLILHSAREARNGHEIQFCGKYYDSPFCQRAYAPLSPDSIQPVQSLAPDQLTIDGLQSETTTLWDLFGDGSPLGDQH